MAEEITVSEKDYLLAILALRTMEQLLLGIESNIARGVPAQEILDNCILDKLKTFEVKHKYLTETTNIGPKGQIIPIGPRKCNGKLI